MGRKLESLTLPDIQKMKLTISSDLIKCFVSSERNSKNFELLHIKGVEVHD